MQLVITLTHDQTLGLVTSKLRNEVVRLNIDENPLEPFSYSWDGIKFSYTYRGFNLREVTSVWYRISYLTYLKEAPGTFLALNRLCREEMVFQLEGLLHRAKWVSKPSAIKLADNKQLQLERATQFGFSVPETLVTTSSSEVEYFRNTFGDIVVKPVAKQVITDKNGDVKAIFTSRIKKGQSVDFSMLAQSPAIFQREIVRTCDIRVVVVQDSVYAISIRQELLGGDDVDYRDKRGKRLVYAPMKLPKNLEDLCVEYIKSFNLEYGSLDFIQGIDGKIYFLENNPCGAWVFVQNGGNYPIAERIAKALS